MNPLRDTIFQHPESFLVKTKDGEKHVKIESFGKKTVKDYDIKKHTYIYDFTSRIFIKLDKGRENIMFNIPIKTAKYLHTGEKCTIDDVTEYINNVSDKNDVFVFECKVDQDNWIFAIFPNSDMERDDLFFFYNIYSADVLKEYEYKSSDLIASIKYPSYLTSDLHWVWFRKPGAYVRDVVYKRAQSWIDCNPELSFHLWTNLSGPQEADDFFHNAPKEFLSRITIHYFDEMCEIAKFYISKHPSDLSFDLYKTILQDTIHQSSMVLKTDLFRVMLMLERGGWYTDFNDTICLIPLRFLVKQTSSTSTIPRYFGTCFNHDIVNNYLMYITRDDPYCIEKMHSIMNNSIYLYEKMQKNDSMHFFIDIMKEFTEIALNTQETSLTKATFHKYDEWLHTYRREYLMRINPCINTAFEMSDSELLRIIYAIWKHIAPSESCENWINELKNIVRFNRVRRRDIQWKDRSRTFAFHIEDMKKLRDALHNLPESFSNWFCSEIINVNIGKIMDVTNLGFVCRKDENRVTIPHCYLYGNCTFLTSILHIGDGTSVGTVKNEVEPI